MRDEAQKVFDSIHLDDDDVEEKVRNDYDNSLLSVESYTIKSFVFGTGGPHYEVEIKLDAEGEPISGAYVYADWNSHYSEAMTEDELEIFCNVNYIGG